MPGSVRENDHFVRQFVADNKIETILDVGVGSGTYSDILRPQLPTHGVIDGIEVWEPYVKTFGLEDKYDILFMGDARELVNSQLMSFYDLIIFGDILEHTSKEEALTMWKQASKIATWGMISVPIIHYPQGAEFGNPYEVHVQEHLHPAEIVKAYGPFEHVEIYPVTGTFIRRFK